MSEASREAHREANRKYRAANLEARRKADREARRRQRAADPNMNREACRKNYAANAETRREYARQWRADNPWAVLAQTHIKRARAAGVTEVEYVDPLQVFERDGWTCHDCGEPVDPTLKGRHRMMASLDHLVSLSQGGPHTYENCATAHYKCNVSRAKEKS